MNASPTVRVLQAAVLLLGVAIAVLFTLLALRDDVRPAAAADHATPAVHGSTAAPGTVDAIIAPAVAATPAEAARPVDAPPAASPTAVLYGTLSKADGAPVEQGWMHLYRDGAHVDTATLRTGTFAVAGLAPGPLRITTRCDDEMTLETTVDVVAPQTRVDLRLPERWLLTVNAVTPDGAPFREAFGKAAPRSALFRGFTAAAFADPLAGDLPPSNTSELEVGIGRFRGAELFHTEKAMPKQTVGLLALPPGQPVHVALLLRNAVVAQQAVAAGQPEVTFTLDPAVAAGRLAKVRVRLLDEAGKPVAGARVSLNDAQTGGGGQPTGEDGRVALESVAPGRLDFEVWHKDLAGPAITMEIAPGADLDLGDVVLRAPVTLELALEQLGKGSRVVFSRIDPTLPPGHEPKDLFFSADNNIATLRVAPGRWGLFAYGPNGVGVLTIDTVALPTTPLRFDLKPGAKLRLRNVSKALGARVVLRTQGVLVQDRELAGDYDYTWRLPLGDYEATVHTAGRVERRTFTLGADGATFDV